MISLLALLALLSLGLWVYLVLFRGWFWRADQELEDDYSGSGTWPDVLVLVPARNEADVLDQTLDTLLQQDYPGRFHVVLVDDHSSDGTPRVAAAVAEKTGQAKSFTLVRARRLPEGWTGKLWALAEGYAQGREVMPEAKYVWLSDADIAHWLANLRNLVAKAESEKLDMVSLMATLSCASPWERLLIPPFVFFFQKLYPFRWVNDPRRETAGAAGGCVLLDRSALDAAGGFEAIRGALIDDCALASRIKAVAKERGRGVWLGLGSEAESVRPYEGLGPIWTMVARSAYTQLDHKPWKLAAAVAGMLVAYLVPPLAVVFGLLGGLFLDVSLADTAATAMLAGAGAFGLMSLAYWPTLQHYGEPPWAVFLLPLAALLYTAMTLDSARRHRSGKGGLWKGRAQGESIGLEDPATGG